jgi:hypothetical protein
MTCTASARDPSASSGGGSILAQVTVVFRPRRKLRWRTAEFPGSTRLIGESGFGAVALGAHGRVHAAGVEEDAEPELPEAAEPAAGPGAEDLLPSARLDASQLPGFVTRTTTCSSSRV